MAEETRHNRLELSATPRAPYQARQHVRKTLANWGHHHVIEEAELVISELTTNAVTATQHLPTPADATLAAPAHIWIDLYQGPTFVLLEVWDPSPERPHPRTATPDEEGGRGLTLVAQLTTHWGYRPLPGGGKITWALLELDRSRAD